MNPDQELPPFQPAQAQAWDNYVNETTAPRQRYDRIVTDARARFDSVKAAAEAARNIAVEIAWEDLQATLVTAWQAYESDTKPARHMRNWSLDQTQMIELRQ